MHQYNRPGIVNPPLMNELLSALGTIASSETLNWVFLGVLAYVGVLWIAVILWVTKDITNRSNSMTLQIVSISLVILLTPIFGLPLYILFRPSRTLMERYFEEVEQDMIEQYYDSVETMEAPLEDLPAAPKAPKKSPAKKTASKKEAAEVEPVDDLD